MSSVLSRRQAVVCRTAWPAPPTSHVRCMWAVLACCRWALHTCCAVARTCLHNCCRGPGCSLQLHFSDACWAVSAHYDCRGKTIVHSQPATRARYALHTRVLPYTYDVTSRHLSTGCHHDSVDHGYQHDPLDSSFDGRLEVCVESSWSPQHQETCCSTLVCAERSTLVWHNTCMAVPSVDLDTSSNCGAAATSALMLSCIPGCHEACAHAPPAEHITMNGCCPFVSLQL